MSSPGKAPRAYEIDGQPASAEQFIRAACDPRHSVVVEACAGSGKTWLLVARMVRLLLAGTAPGELLAITFTRKAAQEMRERLLTLLHELAVEPEAQVRSLLRERGVAAHELDAAVPVARGLCERVLSSSQSLSIDTFHSWFARLLRIAPLAAGVPHGHTLAEATGTLVHEAWGRLMQGLSERPGGTVQQALLRLYELVGDATAMKLLDAFLARRAEWWVAQQSGDALAWLQELCGTDGQADARLGLWDDAGLQARILRLAGLLAQGTSRNRERAARIEAALGAGPGLPQFSSLLAEFCDDQGNVRSNDHRRGKLQQAIGQQSGTAGTDAFEREFAALAAALQQRQRRSCEPQVLALNEALFAVGVAYVDAYQALKAEQRVFDFTDLEWQAWRLLANDEHAAYLQSRLDARYKHILLDEFQDTNPLQWSIVRAWLEAYGADVARPGMFVVGDPKQSIYRFRRAEPRVFAAARDLLAVQGALLLRTSQTRRNAAAIVDLLNESCGENPIYSPQSTLAQQAGAVWRLPLIRADEVAETRAEADAGTRALAATGTLRDPLTTPRAEQEDARRYDEGRGVAQAILHARRTWTLRSGGTPGWSDFMLLVKKRTCLSAYESALRDAGIPFISDRRGGLLESLEVGDLIALLRFLITPGDNRALAHVLKSPIFGADDRDLIALAERGEDTWWQRLQQMALAEAPTQLQRAAGLLAGWLHAAPRLPVHDLLDLILHQGRLTARYAEAAPPLARSQVIGNIEAFIELALNLDAGRYPSLPKFIDALRALGSDAPDEASIDPAADAVRILTIHGAKGLEAPIVVLLDANHSEPARDDAGILCDWPQDAPAPTHFSAFGRTSERGCARDVLFDAEAAIKTQEDWNLLYVAATRAREILILSGVAGTRKGAAEGVIEGSWYARLMHAAEIRFDTDLPMPEAARNQPFSLAIFDPPVLAAAPAQTEVPATAAIEEGIALHALLERLTLCDAWPIVVPAADVIARWLRCPPELADVVRTQAMTIFGAPELERFFNPACYRRAHNEMEVMTPDLWRFDRVVVFEDAVWILDYKRNFLESEHALYRAQLARYRAAGSAVFPGMPLRTALITADGKLWVID